MEYTAEQAQQHYPLEENENAKTLPPVKPIRPYDPAERKTDNDVAVATQVFVYKLPRKKASPEELKNELTKRIKGCVNVDVVVDKFSGQPNVLL